MMSVLSRSGGALRQSPKEERVDLSVHPPRILLVLHDIRCLVLPLVPPYALLGAYEVLVGVDDHEVRQPGDGDQAYEDERVEDVGLGDERQPGDVINVGLE